MRDGERFSPAEAVGIGISDLGVRDGVNKGGHDPSGEQEGRKGTRKVGARDPRPRAPRRLPPGIMV